MELLESIVQGILQLLHLAGLLSAQADNPLVLLLQQELEHIQQGHGIVVRVLKDSAVFLHAQAVSLVEQPGQLDVHARQLGKLPGGQLVGEVAAVLHLNVGQAGGGRHVVQGLHPAEHRTLAVVVPTGNQYGNGVGIAEGLVDLVHGDTGLRTVA